MSATVYIDAIQKDDGVGLKPLALSVLFHGSMPHVFQTATRILLEITINVPSEFSGYVVPILDAAPLMISSLQPRLRMPSFFPLPSDFDPFTARCWVTLLYQLESWLILCAMVKNGISMQIKVSVLHKTLPAMMTVRNARAPSGIGCLMRTDQVQTYSGVKSATAHITDPKLGLN
ncbi:hypothetical protein BDR07DRAFT_1384336 [Suillus spraguei]|nr:hypothetical protein BDR07DRAFT_1384336 [Suillus spraguei]